MISGLPDVTAYELAEARERLAAAGWQVADVIETRPPRGGAGKGAARVARQRVTGERLVELVVVYTEYERSRQPNQRDR